MSSVPAPGSEGPAPGRRRATAPVVMFVAVLVVVAVVVALLAGRTGGAPVAGSGSGTRDRDAAETSAATEPAPTCRPGPEQPAPTIDLGVQPAIGAARLLRRSRVDRLVGLARDAGASVISTTTSWRYLQPLQVTTPGNFRYRGLDRVIESASAAGMQVRLQLIGIPSWASDDASSWTRTTPPTTPAELQRWTTFITKVARHIDGRVDYLEIWNEPNGEVYWPTGPNPAQFARLMAATYEPVKAVAPDLEIISGGLVANDVGYLDTLYQAVEDLDISPVPFDLVGVHPFTGAGAPGDVDAARRFERPPFGQVDDNFTGFRSLREVMDERGDQDADLYISAFGYGARGNRGDPAVPDAERARFATQALEIVTCTPYVRAFSWYYLHPTPFDPVWWTLLDQRLRPTLTYQAFADWATQAAASGAPET